MIKLILSLRAVVNDESIKSSYRDQLDINNTWEMAEQVTKVLEPLVEACEIMCMEQVPTLSCVPGGGGGTPYDDQCTMLGGLDPHFRAWLDPIGSIFELGSIP